jgi:hypothetical protein
LECAEKQITHIYGQYSTLGQIVSSCGDLSEILAVMLSPARLIGAFDASGKADRSCLVVAGFISSLKDWEAFDTSWRKRLAADELTYFHMADLAGCREEFSKGWKDDEPRRRALLSDLVGIIQAHAYRSFVSVVENKHFARLSTENQKSFALDAYSLAGRSAVAKISTWRKITSGFEGVPTAYVFEEGDEGAGNLMKSMLRDGYPSPQFGAKKDGVDPDGNPIVAYTPLQAADLLAYEVFRLYDDISEGKGRFSKEDKWRWAMQEFLKTPGDWGYYTPKNLDEINEKLRTLIEDANPATTDESAEAKA